MARAKAFSPKARIASTCCSAANCRRWRRRRRRCCRKLGPSISFPVAGFWRDATTASLPGTGGTDNDMSEWLTAWEGKSAEARNQGPALSRTGRGRQVGELPRRGRRQRKDHRDLEAVGRNCSAALTRSTSARTIRKRTCGSWTTTCRSSTDSRTTASKLLQTIGTPGVAGADAHSLQPPDVPRLAARRHFLRLRRLHRHARREVRQERKISHGLGQARAARRAATIDTRPGYFSNVHGVADRSRRPITFS